MAASSMSIISLNIRTPKRKERNESKNWLSPSPGENLLPKRLLLVFYWLELDHMLTARPIIGKGEEDHDDRLRPAMP